MMFFKKQSHNDDLLAHSDPANAKRALGHYLNYGISYTFCEMLKIDTHGSAERPEQRNKLLTCEFLQTNLTLKAQLRNFVWNLGDVIKGLNYDVIVTSSEPKMPFFGKKR